MEIINAGNRMFVKAENDVAFAHSGPSCRAVALERYDQDSALNRKVIVANDAARKRNILSSQADVTPAHFTVPNETAGNKLGCIDRCGKADSLSWQNHRRVYPNHFAARINQRAS